LCKGLRGKAVAQLFVQIHSYPECARMHAHFAAAYLAASEEIPRKPVTLQMGLVAAAVA
jgi:hypothetical protein